MVTRAALTLPFALAPDEMDRWLAPARAGTLAVFLDYDGTLTPIVGRPEQATLTEPMRTVLAELAARCPVTIVTGRDVAVVRAFVRLDGLGYVGNHGLDIVGPPGSGLRRELASSFVPTIDDAEDRLRSSLRGIDGVIVERKRFSVSAHVRLAAAAAVPGVEAAVAEVAAAHPTLRREAGKKVFELRPDIDWDKGAAVAWLLDEMGMDAAAALYIGDDLTDEHAFAVLVGTGTTIIVADDDRPTRARLRLAGPDGVQLLLKRLVATLPITGANLSL